jgi:hypothetical protein
VESHPRIKIRFAKRADDNDTDLDMAVVAPPRSQLPS